MELRLDPFRYSVFHMGLSLLTAGNSWWVGLEIHLSNFSCPSSNMTLFLSLYSSDNFMQENMQTL